MSRHFKKTKKYPSYLGNLLDRYIDKNGVRIFIGQYYDDSGAIIIDVNIPPRKSYKKNWIKYRRWRCSDTLLSSPDLQCAIPRIEDFCSCMRILQPFKVARRWFLKRARKLRYGNYLLEDFLDSSRVTIDFNKAERLLRII